MDFVDFVEYFCVREAEGLGNCEVQFRSWNFFQLLAIVNEAKFFHDRRAALGAAALFPAGHSSEERTRGRAVVWARGADIDSRWPFCTLLKTARLGY